MNIGMIMSTQPANATAQATKKSASGGDGPFLSTLNQLMGESTETTTGANVLPFWFTESETSLDQMLGGSSELLEALEQLLTLQPEQMEDQLAKNPELLQMVQAWIQQAAAFLQSQGSETATAEQQTAIQMLAEEPQTVMLVVRDQFEQIKQLVKTTAPLETQQAKLVSAEGQKLMQQLDTLITQIAGKEAKPVVHPTQVTNPAHPSANQSMSEITTRPMVQSVTTDVEQLRAAKSVLVVNEGTTSTANDGQVTNQVMTAGQFALRAEGTGAPKTAVPIQASHFSQEMSTFVVKQLAFTTHEGVSQAKITLYPEHLGQVDVRLTMQHGQLIAHFITEHAAAKDMIDQQLSMLRSALQSQGIQVDKLEVSQQVTQTTSSTLSSNMFHGERQSNPQGQSSQRSSSNESAIVDEHGEILEVDVVEEPSVRRAVMGSSFEASI